MSKSAFELPEYLVSCKWLQEHHGEPDLVVIDIRGYVRTQDRGGGRQVSSYEPAPDEYAQGHIPGAVYVDWTRDIVDASASVKAQIAQPEAFAEAMSTRGIGDATRVVVADHTGGHFATRMWWALRYYGHDRVALLDGGYKRWEALGLPLDTGVTGQPGIATFTAKDNPDLIANVDDVAALVHVGEGQLIDARDAATFSGETQRGARGGHIPTATHFPASAMFGSDGMWKSPDEIRQLADDSGLDLNAPTTAYCNGGVTATAVLFGLMQAGATQVRNYDGSWNEWGEREDLPVEGNRDLWGR